MGGVMRMTGSGFAPMTPLDLDEVLCIERQACLFPWSRGNVADSIASGHVCQVYRRGDELLGYFILMMAVDEAHLLNIVVAPARQGGGLGARLLRRVMRMARHAGACRLLLEVRPSNTAALALYRRSNFRQIGVRRDYYRDAGRREDALVMVCDLMESAESVELAESPAPQERGREVVACV